MTQVRLAIMSCAGGTGKSTVATNLAYSLACLGKSVCLIDCDSNGTAALFTGLENPSSIEETLVAALKPGFKGPWPLKPVWRDYGIEKVDAVLGGHFLNEGARQILKEPRAAYLLADAIEDAPLPHDVVIFDCPGTIEQFHQMVLPACNQILIVLKPDTKDINAGFGLIQWIAEFSRDLRLKPKPKILGVQPNAFDKDAAMHRECLADGPGIEDSLPVVLRSLPEPIHVFPSIQQTRYLTNAGAVGLPLRLYRSDRTSWKIAGLFEALAKAVLEADHG